MEKEWTDINTEMIQMLELSNKDIKAPITKVL